MVGLPNRTTHYNGMDHSGDVRKQGSLDHGQLQYNLCLVAAQSAKVGHHQCLLKEEAGKRYVIYEGE